MSLGIVTVVACLGLLVAVESGCAAQAERTTQASTTSVELAPPSVRLPARPRRYAVPAGARSVSSSQQLSAALANGRRETLVLEPGTYDSPRAFADREGDRLYAARLGKVVMRAGIVLGANTGRPGASIRGLIFDVSDPSEARGNRVPARQILDRGSARISSELHGEPEVQAALMETMGLMAGMALKSENKNVPTGLE